MGAARAAIVASICMAAALASACGVANPPSTTPAISAIPDATTEPTLPAAFGSWVTFRQGFGLDVDPAWVLEVASRNDSLNETGIPLTRDELAKVIRAVQSTGPLAEFVTHYGEQFPDSFGGVRVEGRTVVLEMRDDVQMHLDYLHEVIPFAAALDVRKVEWSTRDLEAFAQTVVAQSDWFPTIGARLVQAHASSTNLVRVRVVASSEDAEAVIRSHFGSPSWMRVEVEAPLPWEGATGTLELRAVDGAGRPIRGLICSWRPLDPTINAESAIGFVTTDDGVCRVEFLPATTFDVYVSRESRVVGNGRVTVPPNGLGVVRIVAGD